MKQLLFMLVVTGFGTIGTVFIGPFCGVAVYYFYAVLRPQYIWAWSLPPGIAWSWYVAVTTIVMAMVDTLFGGGAAGSEVDRSGRARFSAAHYLTVAFGLWIGVSYLTAQNRQAASWVANEYTKIFAMFVVSALVIHSVRQLWILVVMTAFTLAYIAYEINFQYLVNHYVGIYFNGYGGLDNNGAGLMLAMGAPLCYFTWEYTQKWWRWAFLAFVPVIVHAVLLTYSRGAMVSLLAASPLLFLRSRQKRILTVLALLFFLLVLPTLAGKEIRQRFFTIEQYETDETANSRFMSWRAAWNIAAEHPIVGVGPRNSRLFALQFGADREGRTIHNQYLQIAADNGFVGMGLYIVALAVAWWMVRRSRRATYQLHSDADRREYYTAVAVECSMAVFCFGALFLSLEVFELPYLLLLIAAQLGVVGGSTHVDPLLSGTDLSRGGTPGLESGSFSAS